MLSLTGTSSGGLLRGDTLNEATPTLQFLVFPPRRLCRFGIILFTYIYIYVYIYKWQSWFLERHGASNPRVHTPRFHSPWFHALDTYLGFIPWFQTFFVFALIFGAWVLAHISTCKIVVLHGNKNVSGTFSSARYWFCCCCCCCYCC